MNAGAFQADQSTLAGLQLDDFQNFPNSWEKLIGMLCLKNVLTPLIQLQNESEELLRCCFGKSQDLVNYTLAHVHTDAYSYYRL